MMTLSEEERYRCNTFFGKRANAGYDFVETDIPTYPEVPGAFWNGEEYRLKVAGWYDDERYTSDDPCWFPDYCTDEWCFGEIEAHLLAHPKLAAYAMVRHQNEKDTIVVLYTKHGEVINLMLEKEPLGYVLILAIMRLEGMNE